MSVQSILRINVINDSTVQELIGSRFYEGELASVKDPIPSCANFTIGGGSFDPNIPFIDDTAKIWAWSIKNYYEAQKVFEAIRNVLHTKRFTDSNIRVVFRLDFSPIDYYDPVSKWYARVGNFSAKIIEI